MSGTSRWIQFPGLNHREQMVREGRALNRQKNEQEWLKWNEELGDEKVDIDTSGPSSQVEE